ncbi:transposase [Marinimicrobium locisalis]|uniref:transposase n=1 Tax=Marinimicrobium locisalis TaxID=546022 RepID=UPI003D2FD082
MVVASIEARTTTKHYSHERKAAIFWRMAPPQSLTVAEVARQEGISTGTLYNWRKAARERGAVLPSRSAAPGQWSSEEEFRVVLETASLSETEFGEYCRSKGGYSPCGSKTGARPA